MSSGTRFDPQGKGLGEWLRSRHVDVPVALLDDPAVAVPRPPGSADADRADAATREQPWTA